MDRRIVRYGSDIAFWFSMLLARSRSFATPLVFLCCEERTQCAGDTAFMAQRPAGGHCRPFLFNVDYRQNIPVSATRQSMELKSH
jgi:hypothetical protein